jgi:hypothetical protein
LIASHGLSYKLDERFGIMAQRFKKTLGIVSAFVPLLNFFLL